MSDREDIAQDAWYDKQRKRHEVEYKVKLTMTATVYVRAEDDIDEDLLEEKAWEKLTLYDIDDDENCKMIECEVV